MATEYPMILDGNHMGPPAVRPVQLVAVLLCED